MITTSLRWKLLAWIALLLACILAGFGITAYELTRRSRLAQIDEALTRRVAALAAEVRGGPGGPPSSRSGERNVDRTPPRRPPSDSNRMAPPDRPSGPRPGEQELNPANFGQPGGTALEPPEFRGGMRQVRLSAATAGLFNETSVDDYFFGAWGRDGAVSKISANAPAGLTRPASAVRGGAISPATHDGYRLAGHVTELNDCVVAGISLAPYRDNLRHFAWWLSGAGLGVLALGLGGGWLIASRAMRPIDEISAAARRISAGNLAERVRVSDPTNELGRLAAVLNSTFARLEAAFDEQKQFTADASHELRTPLAVLISEAQAALTRPRTDAEYRETIQTCLEAAQEMRQLAESLLELARIDSGQANIRHTPFDLAEIVQDGVVLLSPLAARREIRIETALSSAPMQGDPGRVKQVLINLLDNAIYYNVERGSIRLETRSEKSSAILVVSDTGPGISAEDLPHIFKRFYRADKSRSHSERRSGLGLAIVKSIVEAHGGTIEVTSRYGAGTTFTVRLPQ